MNCTAVKATIAKARHYELSSWKLVDWPPRAVLTAAHNSLRKQKRRNYMPEVVIQRHKRENSGETTEENGTTRLKRSIIGGWRARPIDWADRNSPGHSYEKRPKTHSHSACKSAPSRVSLAHTTGLLNGRETPFCPLDMSDFFLFRVELRATFPFTGVALCL